LLRTKLPLALSAKPGLYAAWISRAARAQLSGSGELIQPVGGRQSSSKTGQGGFHAPREPRDLQLLDSIVSKTCLCHHPLAPGDPFGKPSIQLSFFCPSTRRLGFSSAFPISSDSASLSSCCWLRSSAGRAGKSWEALYDERHNYQLSAREDKSPKAGTLKRLKAPRWLPAWPSSQDVHFLVARQWQRMRSRSDANCLRMEMGGRSHVLKWHPPILISTLSTSRFFQDKVPPVDPRGDHVRNSRLLPRKRTSPRKPFAHLARSAVCESAFKRPGRDAQIAHDCFCASFCLTVPLIVLAWRCHSSGRLQQS
jgi:hypothetical protein